MVSQALSRTILLVDVESFNDRRRTDSHRLTIHDSLYNILRKVLHGAGIDDNFCRWEDRGDGVMILVLPDVEKKIFSESVPGRLATALNQHNKAHKEQEHIRLRMALHAGEVTFDNDGVVSGDLNMAFRLLDAEPLKKALKEAQGAIALIASSWFYYSVIKNSSKFREEAYSPVLINAKETRAIAWITLPGRRDKGGPRAQNEPWRIRLQDSAGRVHGPGIMMRGRYAMSSVDVVAKALWLPSQGGMAKPSGQVLFNVPARPALGVQRAEIIAWHPARPDSGSPGLVGLSIAGPTIRGIEEPVFRFDLGPDPRIVRLRACAGVDDGQARLPSWGLLPLHNANDQELLPLDRLTESAPDITSECHGSDVVDERTGAVLGIAAVTPATGSGGYSWMTPIGKIAQEWPLLRRIAAQGEHGVSHHLPAATFSRADILRFAEQSLQIPALAATQSRHLIVTELPADVMLTAPRSSVDRADLTALLWSCACAPSALKELAGKIRESSPGGRKEAELADDLERFSEKLLPSSLPYVIMRVVGGGIGFASRVWC